MKRTGMNKNRFNRISVWFSGREFVPPHIGEYRASTSQIVWLLRWWNGEYWSMPYSDNFSDESKRSLRRRKSTATNEQMFFCGLVNKPKVHSILYLQPLK